MAKAIHITTPMELGEEVCKALEIDANRVQRIIIDIDVDKPIIIIYIQMIGDGRLLSVNWGAGFDGASVTVLDENDPDSDSHSGPRARP